MTYDDEEEYEDDDVFGMFIYENEARFVDLLV
jgi:hypothetical protein